MSKRIDYNEFNTYFFDVFDTLITRPFLKPTDLFLEVAARAYDLGLIKQDIKKFQQNRIIAEVKARKSTTLEDVTIDEIYSFLESEELLDEIKELEITTEIELVVPIKKNIDIFNDAIKNGKNIIIVSDMYLPSSIIQQMLSKTDLLLDNVKIYVSNEYGLTKRSGNLFKLILKNEQLDPKSILHIGNDKKSDYLGSKKAGIKCLLYEDWLPNEYEKITKENILSPGISRAVRLSNGEDNLVNIYSNIISPFLYNYVSFIIKDAISKNIKKIFFLSRDGQIYYKIAKTILKNNKIDISVKYIYASRNAWAYSSILNFNFECLKWIIVDNQCNRIKDLVSRLNLFNYERLIYSYFEINQLLTNEILISFIDTFKGSDIEKYILDQSNRSRNALFNYLEDSNFFDGEIAIVDIGWRLNMQFFLMKIIKMKYLDFKVYGYYLGVNSSHIMDKSILNNVACYVKHPKADVRSIFNDENIFRIPSILLLEHVFSCADHSSLKYIKDCSNNEYELVFGEPMDFNLKNKIKYIHEVVDKYAELYSILDRNIYDTIYERNLVFKNIKKFIFIPQRSAVKSLNFFITNKDICHDKKYDELLANKIGFKNFLFKRSLGAWLYGSIALSNILVRTAFLPFLYFKVKK